MKAVRIVFVVLLVIVLATAVMVAIRIGNRASSAIVETPRPPSTDDGRESDATILATIVEDGIFVAKLCSLCKFCQHVFLGLGTVSL